jgi:YggT family protein
MNGLALHIVAVVLWSYWVVLAFRWIMDMVFQFARSYEPHGAMLVAVESAYTVTDPPLRFLRRHIPPLRIGGIALDLAFILLLVILWILLRLVGSP